MRVDIGLLSSLSHSLFHSESKKGAESPIGFGRPWRATIETRHLGSPLMDSQDLCLILEESCVKEFNCD